MNSALSWAVCFETQIHQSRTPIHKQEDYMGSRSVRCVSGKDPLYLFIYYLITFNWKV